jgi:hypothetical protein
MRSRLILSWARAYAAHVELKIPEVELRAEVSRRLALIGFWPGLWMALGAGLSRWFFPLILLGKPVPFESLGPDRKEEMLRILQETPSISLRLSFFGLKSLILCCCYGWEGYFSGLGYRTDSGASPSKIS